MSSQTQQHDEETGVGLKPGDEHYRAYVGPPERYDLITAMVFNLLTSVGLRQHHRLLDIGCGSLRLGRLFIPYLNRHNYIGVEPNEWLVEEGVRKEIGQDMVAIKQPVFSYQDSLADFQEPLQLDFAVAQSIFSHCSRELIADWLKQVSFHLKESGALFATFLIADEDFQGEGWVYPGCVRFTVETMSQLAADNGLQFSLLDWKHPGQSWAVFAKPGYDDALIVDGNISWDRYITQQIANK